MVRFARICFVAVMALAVAGAAYACDGTAKASAEKASASSCSESAVASKALSCAADAVKASAEGCSKSAKASTNAAFAGAGCSATKSASAEAGCSAAKAAKAAMADCDFHSFANELHANAEKVHMELVENKDGVTVVFAAATKDDVVAAQTVASKAYAMMSAPAACAYTRSEMANKACDGCKEGLGAFADAKITLENTDNGAETVVKTEIEENIPTLQAFFRGFNPVEETDSDGE